MKLNEEFERFTSRIFPHPTNPTVTKRDIAITLYTGLLILNEMKNTIGLEAMLEYMDRYCRTMERHDPRLRLAVNRALQFANVRKIYADAIKGTQK